MNKIVYMVGLLAPTLVFAQAFPDFPMAFWGRVTINGDPASTGSVVRAYYSDNSLAGEVTVSEPGIYGYSSPLKNKLVVGEGDGEINFRILAPGYNSGNETGGTSALTYSGFVSGETTNKDLAFSIVQPTPTPTQTGGGGGGGGGGGALPPQITPIPSPSTTPTPTPTSSPQQQPVGEVLGITTYRFERDLRVGMRVDDVTELQTRLQQEGVYSGPITGYFGSLTRAAVNTYQKQNGLPQTGYLDAVTRQQLNGEYGRSVAEGALIRAKGDIDVYIVKYVREKKFKRLILSPAVFNNYGHLRWENVLDVDASLVNTFVTADLVRAVGDTKVYRLYPSGDTGERRWIASEEAFAQHGFDWDSIYEINAFDRDSYITASPIE